MRTSGPTILLSLVLIHVLARRAAGCGRQPARVQLPPVQYLRPFVIRKISCEPHELFCANGGRCTVMVKWSVVHGRVEEPLESPRCECPSGYIGNNCEIPDLRSSVLDISAAFVSVGLFAAMLILLLLVVVYLCWMGRAAKRRQSRPDQRVGDTFDGDVGDGVPLATFAIAKVAITNSTTMAFDRASVRDFIDDNDDGDEGN